MNDAAPWVDPELLAAGQLLQSKGLVTPDGTVASLALGGVAATPAMFTNAVLTEVYKGGNVPV